MRVYIDLRDWWVGYYRGDTHHYVCPLPTLVIRWPRRHPVIRSWRFTWPRDWAGPVLYGRSDLKRMIDETGDATIPGTTTPREPDHAQQHGEHQARPPDVP